MDKWGQIKHYGRIDQYRTNHSCVLGNCGQYLEVRKIKNNSLSNFIVWKPILCFLLAIFCESSFALIDPIAIIDDNGIVKIHMQGISIPCVPRGGYPITDCNMYGLQVGIFFPNRDRAAIVYPECHNGICPEQDFSPINTDISSTAEVVVQMIYWGEFIEELESTLVVIPSLSNFSLPSPKNPVGCPSPTVGNPINIVTGNKFMDEVDYKFTGLLPLQFVRHYNSIHSYVNQDTFDNAVLRGHPLGWKWSHNYYQGLTVTSTEVKLTRSNGQSFIFKPGSEGWQPDSDTDFRLQEILAAGVRTGWKITTPDDMVETYSASGKLLSITNPDNLTQTFTYSCQKVSATCPVVTPTTIAPIADLLIRVADSFGHTLNFTYGSRGIDYKRIISMTDPAGTITQYRYDTFGNLKTVIYPDNTPLDLTDNPKKTYVYGSDTGETVNTANVNQPNALTGIIDENGVRYATYQYDANGSAISTEHASGGIEKYSLAYSPDGSSTAVTDPLGSIRTTHFTTVLGVVKSTGSNQPGGSGCGAASSNITYDVNGNVASRTDFNGNRTNYTYDLTRNLETSRTEGLTATGATTPQTRTITTEWHPTFRLPTKITEPGLETTVSYDAKGNITHKSLKDLDTTKIQDWNTTYTYAVSGILLQKIEDGPRTDVSDLATYDYYPEDAVCTGGHLGCRGQLKQVTSALGHATLIPRYSPHGLPEVINDPNGLTTTMVYDTRQRLISLDVGGELTTYSYDPAGLMTRVTQPNGAYLAYRYDNAHRLVEVKDQLGNTRSYTLDNMGNRVKEDLFDPNGQLARSQSRVYDALSRLQNLVLPQ